jgi:hypothetical protein
MKWAYDNKPVGFDLEVNPEKEHKNLVREARNLFIVFAVFIGLFIAGIILLKEGVLSSHCVTLKQPGTALRLNPAWASPTVGSIMTDDEIYPDQQVKHEDLVAWAVKEETEKKADTHGHGHGESHGAKDQGHEEAVHEAKAVEKRSVKGKWYHISAAGYQEDFSADQESVTIAGWLPLEAVEVLPAGFEGAYQRRAGTLDVLWAIAVLCLCIGIFIPRLMVPFVKLWLRVLVGPLGWFNTRLLLSIVFFLAISPLALFRNYWLGKDPLDLQIDKEQESFWQEKKSLERDHFNHIF